jgi:hypothetical protein
VAPEVLRVETATYTFSDENRHFGAFWGHHNRHIEIVLLIRRAIKKTEIIHQSGGQLMD